MHRLLKRQIKLAYGKSVDFNQLSKAEIKLFENISFTYEDNDIERKHADHVLEVNSKDLNEKNSSIKDVLSSLEQAQRLSKTGSWSLNLKNNTLDWSDELFRIFNLKPNQIAATQDHLAMLVHPDDINLSDPDLISTKNNGGFDAYYRLLFDSDKIKYIHDHREVLYDFNNKAVSIQGIVQDITIQKRTEENLTLYADLFHKSGESIIITDENSNIIAVNNAFTLVTGYTIEELKGKNPRILSSGETPQHIYKKMWEELNNTGYWQGELIDKKKNGETYPKWISISVSHDDKGKVKNYIASSTDLSERKMAQERIHHLAHHDGLTGLLNRFSLEERLSQALNSAHRNNFKLAVIYIDMDNFKSINDSMGHSVGDGLLIEVAKRLKTCGRESDIISRVGGDEFIVVLNEISNSFSIASTLKMLIHKLSQPYIINDIKIDSSSSIGISIYPDDGKDITQLMKNSDVAMYHAKELGRNNYQFFSESLNKEANKRIQIEKDLRTAIKEQQFELFYQPQIATDNNDICGVEALIRWHHPQHGLVPPDKFIPIAESTKLILPIGLWVLEEACRQHKEWKNKYNKSLKMAVNLSAQQLRDPNLVEKIALFIKTYQLKKGDLELEITESTAMENPEEAIKLLLKIRELDIELAIDDFGTGYSSLSYLKQLPIQTLKLDRSFVKDINTNKSDAEISAATLALAHNLGLSVVAEGVETKAQKVFLISHKFDVLQGYYFSKPLPAKEFAESIFHKTPSWK